MCVDLNWTHASAIRSSTNIELEKRVENAYIVSIRPLESDDELEYATQKTYDHVAHHQQIPRHGSTLSKSHKTSDIHICLRLVVLDAGSPSFPTRVQQLYCIGLSIFTHDGSTGLARGHRPTHGQMRTA